MNFMKKLYISLALISLMLVSFRAAQAQKGDSVVIRVGDGSKVTIMIKDKKDLETLKHYNFQALMDDMISKLEKRDSTPLVKSSESYRKDTVKTEPATTSTENWDRDRNDDEDNDEPKHHRRYRYSRTHHSINVDLGTNNYLSGGKFPDGSSPYTVKPWGSWYVGLNSVWRTRVANKFFMEWGGGVSWYNFKYENERIVMSKDANSVVFTEDTRDLDFRKSKLTVAYVNAFLVPMVDFGDNGHKPSIFDGGRNRGFRIGAGPYVGYRIDSYAKQTIVDSGDKNRYHNHDNFYLNNVRYGLRLQLGFRDADVFFSYDLNELYTDGKGPKLNAFSFGITL